MDFSINVKDMSCEHCVKSIKEALAKNGSISSVNVDLTTKIVNGSFDEKQTSLAVIKETINNIGFTAI